VDKCPELPAWRTRQVNLLSNISESQAFRASGLNLVVSAIILWNTVYLSRVVESLRTEGHDLPDHIIRHVSPQIWEHINLTGIYDWRGETPQKGTFRPLRAAQEKLRGAA
jgi:Tn3 transposase DDE domain-containing protein